MALDKLKAHEFMGGMVTAPGEVGGPRRRLAVLGSPIEHSLSPVLHSRAYEILGLPFDYERVEVRSGELGAFLEGLDETWVGLSLTMPLKREVVPLLDSASPLVELLGVANTVVFDATSRATAGHNTDVDGITRAIASQAPAAGAAPLAEAERVALLGGGATAASALVAASRLGITALTAFLRDPYKGAELSALGAALGVQVDIAALAELDAEAPFDAAISSLPGGVADPLGITPARPDAVLLDVAYTPWPTALAARWAAAGGSIVSGLDMLVEQAIGQIRLFTGRPHDVNLDDDEQLRSELRSSVGLPARPVAAAPR